MRDRLIELLSSKTCRNSKCIPNCAKCENVPLLDEDVEHLADYLLADGWMRPPVKVGQTVYQVTRNFISEFKVRFIEISTCENVFLHTDLISGIILTGEVFSESEIGKTVFLSEEEAEKALKGGGE